MPARLCGSPMAGTAAAPRLDATGPPHPGAEAPGYRSSAAHAADGGERQRPCPEWHANAFGRSPGIPDCQSTGPFRTAPTSVPSNPSLAIHEWNREEIDSTEGAPEG